MGRMRDPVALAVDIGSSSVKAILFTPRLEPLRATRVGYRWNESAGGRIEIDPQRLERVVVHAIDGALEGSSVPGVAAVGIAAFWHSLLGVDAAGHPTTPLMLWSDRRAEAESQHLRRRLDEPRLHRVTGCRLHSSYWPARLAWFRRHEPQAFRRTARWIGFGEWLAQRWLGREAMSLSQASGTGLFDQRRCTWSEDALDAVRLSSSRLPPLVDLDDADASLTRVLARRWPALAKARWLPAVGDGAANNVGAGCVRVGRAALMIGTSGAVRGLWEQARGERVRVRPGLWRYRLDRRRLVVGGALSNGGNIRDWFLRTFRSSAAVERQALAMGPDSHGLTVLPFLAGMRSPDYVPEARGAIDGLVLGTTPAHVLRAGLEAVAYRFALLVRELESVLRVEEIVAAGGALERSSGWAQIIADVLGRPLTLSAVEELTARGAAAIALETIGALDASRLDPPRGGEVRPDPEHHAVYVRGLRRHMEFLHRGTGSLRHLSL